VAAATALQGPLTRTRGGAFDPAPSSDGRVFFMSLEPDGYVVRMLDKLRRIRRRTADARRFARPGHSPAAADARCVLRANR
jgi:hypothetical protein